MSDRNEAVQVVFSAEMKSPNLRHIGLVTSLTGTYPVPFESCISNPHQWGARI